MDKSIPLMLIYFLIHLGLIFFTFPEEIIASTNSGHWLVILSSIIVHLVVVYLYMKGLSFFPKWDIIHIYLSVGKAATFIFLVPITVYLLTTSILTVRAYSEIVTVIFLSSTPSWAIMILLLVVATYLASRGIDAILRTGVLLGMLLLPLILVISLASFQNTDWNYLFPLFEQNFSFLTTPTYYRSFFAVTGGFLFLGFVQPYFTYQRKRVLLAAVSLIPFFFISVYIPILTFGEATAATLHFPFVIVVETINISWLMFDRFTMAFLLTLIAFIMLFIAITLWQTNRIISKCIPRIKPVYSMLPTSVMIYVCCLLIPDWKTVEHLFLWNTPLRLFILVLVPLSIFYFGLRFRKKVNHERH